MAGWFELKKQKDGQFYFVLKAGNAETILKSEAYRAKDSALNGIHSVQVNSPLQERYERRESRSGDPYFVLKAGNHEVIGSSEMYSDVSAMENGIKSVLTNGSTETVKDLTADD